MTLPIVAAIACSVFFVALFFWPRLYDKHLRKKYQAAARELAECRSLNATIDVLRDACGSRPPTDPNFVRAIKTTVYPIAVDDNSDFVFDTRGMSRRWRAFYTEAFDAWLAGRMAAQLRSYPMGVIRRDVL